MLPERQEPGLDSLQASAEPCRTSATGTLCSFFQENRLGSKKSGAGQENEEFQ